MFRRGALFWLYCFSVWLQWLGVLHASLTFCALTTAAYGWGFGTGKLHLAPGGVGCSPF